ncbi:D-alanyl-D-alanine carboxypeptidase family protein [Nakamurella aerolata]|uniref:D-alanyl-D-alanine carboxypeptidase-like core domain-containing protein n=1 Tax=Nakamurella aerolata TaxID=1656892 RepID=A0A849AB95_9ACTN|nr:D-alanyl-D-alanine carboxypeptidase family protein [Nakamurella aerolata]NNG34182.1 hypothetical protein [Nakamurella aerolata]
MTTTPRRRGAVAGSCLLSVVVGLTVLTGCGSDTAAEPVVVTTTVPAPTGAPADPPRVTVGGSNPPAVPGATAPASTDTDSNAPAPSPAPSTTATRSARPRSTAATSTPSPATKSTASRPSSASKQPTAASSSTGGSGGTGDHPTSNEPDVPREDPGPEGGRVCATNDTYVDEEPTGLRPDVIKAWRNVEKHANADGVIVCLNDGKRSTAQQQAQYDEYVRDYGKKSADQLVLRPEKSAHVTGVAIDIQPAAAYRWLQKTDGAYGFCRRYDNEPWHFEYDAGYFTDGCPARLPKPER